MSGPISLESGWGLRVVAGRIGSSNRNTSGCHTLIFSALSAWIWLSVPPHPHPDRNALAGQNSRNSNSRKSDSRLRKEALNAPAAKPLEGGSSAVVRGSKRLLTVLLIGGVFLVMAIGVLADYFTGLPIDAQAEYIGRQACVRCHQKEVEAYTGSDHHRAMAVATPETVLGDFDDATLEHDGLVSRMFRRADKYFVHTEGEDGQMQDFEVKYVFGHDPLQQYMVEFDRDATVAPQEVARVQVLRISWDTHQRKWFYLRPPDVTDKLEPGDPLHWTGIAQRWQTMCADCHSTNLIRGFDHEALTYHTTFSEIDVSCEACHGPASLHVELASRRSFFWDRHHGYGLVPLKGDDPEPQIQACAPCHSRRGLLSQHYVPGDEYCNHFQLELLREDIYFADGQVLDENYVYGSFIQSRMYHKGIRCTDCHDPHSLKLKHPGNATCTSCHQHPAGKYDTPAHHHHPVGTAGAECVNCHMPSRTYMDVDHRRDHSLRIPRPDLSVSLGTPNACSGCHVSDRLAQVDSEKQSQLIDYAAWQGLAQQGDQEIARLIAETDQWCEDACQQWYGSQRNREPHFAEGLIAFRRQEPGAVQRLLRLAQQPNLQVPAIARATALDEFLTGGQMPAVAVHVAIDRLADESEDSIVRAAAIRVVAGAPLAPRVMIRHLLPLLRGPTRQIRYEAAVGLTQNAIYSEMTASQRNQLDQALLEVQDSLMASNDRAGAHLSWAGLCEQRGQWAAAQQAYETAIRVEPQQVGARSNLASLLEQLASQQSNAVDPNVTQQRLERVKQLRAQELPLLRRDSQLLPDNALLQYRLGLLYYLNDDLDAALSHLQRAVELEPDRQEYRQAVELLKERMSELSETVGD